jgi:CRP/FNR family transcriptional regulator
LYYDLLEEAIMAIPSGSSKYTPYLSYDCPELNFLAHQYGEKISYNKNQIILTAETIVDSVYYIEQGRVRYVTISAEGDEHILGVLGDDSFFGLVPVLLSDHTCEVLVISEAATIVYKIDKDCFIRILNMHTALNLSIIKALAHFGNELIYQIENLLFFDSEERLLNLLYASIDKNISSNQDWYCLKIQYTQEDIGKIIGVSRITVTRIISELCRRKIIRLVNHKIEVKRTPSMDI